MFNAFLQKSHPAAADRIPAGDDAYRARRRRRLLATYEKFFAPKHPINEVKLLGFFANPPGHLYNIEKKPIQSLADLKGKKAWSLPGLTARAMGLTGASVVPGPAVRMYEIISKGVVDAFCCIDYGDMEAYKVLQYVGAVTEVDGGDVLAEVLGVHQQRQMEDRFRPRTRPRSWRSPARRWRAARRRSTRTTRRSRRDYLAQGGIIVKATPAFNAALKKAWQPLYAQWIAEANKEGVDGKAALDYYHERSQEGRRRPYRS